MKKAQILLTLLLYLPSIAFSAQIEGVRLWTAPDHTRLVFDVDKPVTHQVFSLQNPERLVIDIAGARVGKKVKMEKLHDRDLASVRHAPRKGGGLRVVLDLNRSVRPKTFLLKPRSGYGHRLVVDLYRKDAKVKVAKSTKDLKELRDVVVAVDAGHGGEDPGASGPSKRVKEKRVTLQIARRLKRLIDAQPGMSAVLTRSGDYYIGLRKRMQLARKQKADLFVSIHADAFRDKRVRGSSVYVLSRRGASSEAARWLAEKENSADLVGGVSLDDKDAMLASVLLDLSQSATQGASLSAARGVYRQLGKVGKVHGRRVQQAGFMVLKSPDIPSVLVETGFISNPKEARNLSNPQYQERMSKAILNGLKQYFAHSPPPGTLFARQQKRIRQHIIEDGDTLSHIASRYAVSLASLRRENRIKNDRRIHVGQVLRIPGT